MHLYHQVMLQKIIHFFSLETLYWHCMTVHKEFSFVVLVWNIKLSTHFLREAHIGPKYPVF